jgi:hypothetical protein
MPDGEVLSIERKRLTDRGIIRALVRPSDTRTALFVRKQDYWVIRYHGDVALLKSMRGLHYLAVLLHHPGREFHVRELLAGLTYKLPAAAAFRTNGQVYVGCRRAPVLDARAKGEYKRRIKDLRQELNQAEQFHDPQRKSELQSELQMIGDHLANAVGLGGKDRRSSSETERARSSVTKCIKKAIEQIREAIPSLGCHLAARIKTGYFCSYNPRPDRPVAWKF